MNTVLGTTQDYSGCDCCGRENLKKYVVIRLEDGTVGHYGTSCAAVMLRVPAAEVTKAAKAADADAAAKAQAERMARMDAETAAWEAFLLAHGTGSSTLERIRSLGGYAAAKSLYRNV